MKSKIFRSRFIFLLVLSILSVSICANAQSRPQELLASAIADTKVVFALAYPRSLNEKTSAKTIMNFPSSESSPHFKTLLFSQFLQLFNNDGIIAESSSTSPSIFHVIGINQTIPILPTDSPVQTNDDPLYAMPYAFKDKSKKYLLALKLVDREYLAQNPASSAAIEYYQKKGIQFYHLYNGNGIYQVGNVSGLRLVENKVVLPQLIVEDLKVLTANRDKLLISSVDQRPLILQMKTDLGKEIAPLVKRAPVPDLNRLEQSNTLQPSTKAMAVDFCETISNDCPKVNSVRNYECIPPGNPQLVP